MIQCFKCGCEEIRDHQNGIMECAKCQAREAHGEPMPRIVVQPHPEDQRFLVVTFDDDIEGQKVMDRQLARMLATAILSVTN